MKLCISLHDVAPSTWAECRVLLKMLKDIGSPPTTLLVVPNFHGQGYVNHSREVCRSLDQLQSQGHEIALHGYLHRDDGSAPRTLVDWARRRLLTAGEGEFATLDEGVATMRIAAGRHLFADAGWQVSGFVPPAWLAGPAALLALRKSGLVYSADHGGLIDLVDGRRLAAPAITASSRRPWRRFVSRFWLRSSRALTLRHEYLRVALHPGDAHHADLMHEWHRLLLRLLESREAITKLQAMRESSPNPSRISG